MDLKKSAIAQGIKSLRLEKNYTQEYVATILGKEDGSAVYRLESGKSELKLEDAAKLAELYDITIDEIYDPSKRARNHDLEEPAGLYTASSSIHISIVLDGTALMLQKQIEMLQKVNAALAKK